MLQKDRFQSQKSQCEGEQTRLRAKTAYASLKVYRLGLALALVSSLHMKNKHKNKLLESSSTALPINEEYKLAFADCGELSCVSDVPSSPTACEIGSSALNRRRSSLVYAKIAVLRRRVREGCGRTREASLRTTAGQFGSCLVREILVKDIKR